MVTTARSAHHESLPRSNHLQLVSVRDVAPKTVPPGRPRFGHSVGQRDVQLPVLREVPTDEGSKTQSHVQNPDERVAATSRCGLWLARPSRVLSLLLPLDEEGYALHSSSNSGPPSAGSAMSRPVTTPEPHRKVIRRCRLDKVDAEDPRLGRPAVGGGWRP